MQISIYSQSYGFIQSLMIAITHKKSMTVGYETHEISFEILMRS